MNPKKQKLKDRRRARKLAEEAWAAIEDGNLDLAEKIIRRAVLAQEDNPVLWNDQGMILNLRGKEAEAASAFRAAITLTSDYAEAYANLAAMRFRQGFANEAFRLQSQAVEHDPENATYSRQLEAYRSMTTPGMNQPKVVSDSSAIARENPPPTEWAAKLDMLNWDHLSDQLTREGCVLIPRVIDDATCRGLTELFADDSLFAKTVVMNQIDYGIGTYRYFRAPIPDVVNQLRVAFYAHVARTVNHWQELLGEEKRFPDLWERFRDECHQGGQCSSTPILLKYSAGGFNALHRDLRGSIFFPVQLAAILSPRSNADDPTAQGFRGGDFLFCDVPEEKKSRRRVLSAGLGDVILFCTRDRLAPVGGAYGLQPVKHGVTTIEAGERCVLGIPFHEYR